MLTTLVTAVIGLVGVGLIVYLVETKIPMFAPIRLGLRVAVVLVLILWLLNLFGR
jgi:hypothetical protein